MSKILFLNLFLVCSLLVSINSLRVSRIHQLQKIFRHDFGLLKHLDSEEDFNKWLQSNPDVSSAMKDGKPLSSDAQSKLKDELKTYPDLMQKMLGTTQSNECFDKLSDDQKQKFYGFILDEVDLTNTFVPGAQVKTLNDQNWKNIGQETSEDSEMSDKLKPCYPAFS